MHDVVDIEDNVVGQADKATIAAGRLISRVSFVLLMDHQGRVALQQRSARKASHPLMWSGSVAGHVQAGESYEACASRELTEELGVTTPLAPVGKFYSESERKMVGVFIGNYDGPFSLRPSEVAQVRFFSLPELRRTGSSLEFTSFVAPALALAFPNGANGQPTDGPGP